MPAGFLLKCADKRSIVTLLALVLGLTCSCVPDSEPTLPQAFIAPATVNLRSELNQKNSTVAVLKHGNQVSIVDVRRRYVRVKTSRGAEGWVDSADLLRPQDMQRIRKEHQDALKLPSEAVASAYENLNVHLEPSRASPAFAQVPEGGAVNVLARSITPKVSATARPPVLFERPKPLSRRRKKEKKRNPQQPPMPLPPKPPGDWTAAWGKAEQVESVSAPAKKPDKKEAPPPVLESWSLVRTKENQTGWVLSRNLMMSIPDDVAQYAEGKHITSYFDLGTVNDEERGPKHNWLWTTASSAENLDFDSWRVFLWNRRRHRFETSYRQRDVEGYFPVHVDPAVSGSLNRTFDLILKNDNGQLERRTYLFDGTRVHLTGVASYDPNAAARSAREAATKAAQQRTANESWLKKEWNAFVARITAARH